MSFRFFQPLLWLALALCSFLVCCSCVGFPVTAYSSLHHPHSHLCTLYDVVPAATTMMMPGQMSYRLIASKQMVGLFLSVWARKELIPHISHLRLDSVGRGIMGRLGNKVVTQNPFL